MTEPLILVDGSSYFFRAFHALPPLINSKGNPTGAVYGVANMVRRLLKDHPNSPIAVVFDAKGKNFRHALYPAYKAHRPPVPEDLSQQFHPLVHLLKTMGLPVLIIDGVEADDVIGTLAAHATQQNIPVIISTSDKDMAQLVNEHVSLVNTMNNTIMDIQGVQNKFAVHPSQIIDYLTLVGDTSDNIPGVKQCGPKTAVKWLQEYKTLDNLVQHAAEITGKIGESLRACLPNIPLCKQLVTIKTDVHLPIKIEELQPQNADKNALIDVVRELEFKSWIKEFSVSASEKAKEMNDKNSITPFSHIAYTLITTQDALLNWLQQITPQTLLCIDTETTSLDTMEARLVGISLAIEENNPVYIPLAHTESSPQLSLVWVLEQLKPYLENPTFKKVGQNLKYDYQVFKNYQIALRGIAYDTLLESYLLDSSASRHDMDSLAAKYLHYTTITYEEVAGKGSKQVSFDQVTIAQAAPYAAEDADITLKLHHTLLPLLAEPVKNLLNTIEIPLITVLAEMERHGVLIDVETLKHHGIRLKERLITLEKEATDLAGQAFNLNSPKQLQEILFDKLQLPVISKTPTGQASTSEAVLQELAYQYPLPAIILEYRSLSKLVSTYIDALPKRIHAKTQRVHTSYNQAVTATGRLSSSDPNLQNIPIRTEEGRLIRRAFIAPKDCLILAADYSQIELRLMAHLSQDPALLTAFRNDWDVHTATASELFQIPQYEVTEEQRRRAKAVNFGLIYGMSAFGLAKQINTSREEAQYYIQRYFERYPGVLEYMNRSRALAREKGYVETLFGRRLYLPEIRSPQIPRQKAAERAAINAPLQGSAADIIKQVMIHIYQWQNSTPDCPAYMIMQVHDELVFEVAESALESCQNTIRHYMENAIELDIPLKVSIGVGANWDEAH